MPLVLPAKVPRYALSLSSVASFYNATPSWNPGDGRLELIGKGTASSIAVTGLGKPLRGDEKDCRVVEANQRPVYRVLAPFPRELDRNHARVIPFEDLIEEDPSKDLRAKLEGALVLIGLQLPNQDVHHSCDTSGCNTIHGLSLHAAAIDTLMADEKNGAIKIIPPALQLCWVTLLCAAGAWSRFATAHRSARTRWGLLAILVALDVVLTVVLAANMAVLVDTLHHIAALCLCYYIVSRIEPARSVLQ